MKKIKSIRMLIPENSDDLFVDEGLLEEYRKKEGMKWGPWGRPYDGLVLGFGKNVFVFDVDSCEFREGDKMGNEGRVLKIVSIISAIIILAILFFLIFLE